MTDDDKEWRSFYAGFAAKHRGRFFAPEALRAAALIAYRRKLLAEAYYVFS